MAGEAFEVIDVLATSDVITYVPVIAVMAGEALEVIDVRLGPHHHLEGGDRLAAGGAVTRRPEQSVDQTRHSTCHHGTQRVCIHRNHTA